LHPYVIVDKAEGLTANNVRQSLGVAVVKRLQKVGRAVAFRGRRKARMPASKQESEASMQARSQLA